MWKIYFQDASYFERRRKNNDAAKRSRDQRRQKEEQTAQRANFLEQVCLFTHLLTWIFTLEIFVLLNSKTFDCFQENLQLRSQVASLRAQIEQLRASSAGFLTPGNTNGLSDGVIQRNSEIIVWVTLRIRL